MNTYKRIDPSKLNKWDKRFYELAEYISKWSKDEKAQVGAVITTDHGGAIALGYNGFPSGVDDSVERLEDKDLKLEMITHAEQNALLIAGRSTERAAIYVYGKPICSRCACLIIQSGITSVVSLSPEVLDKDSKWLEPGMIALQMFKEAGVKFTLLDVAK